LTDYGNGGLLHYKPIIISPTSEHFRFERQKYNCLDITDMLVSKMQC